MQLSRRDAEESDVRPEKRALAGKRVLLAQTDAVGRAMLARALRASGGDVVEATDGGRLLVALASHCKDGRSPNEIGLIVTDLCMPVVGGLDVCRGVRAAGWPTPLILVTSNDAPEVHDAARRLDATLFANPLDLDLFEQAVRAAMTNPRRARLTRPRPR